MENGPIEFDIAARQIDFWLNQMRRSPYDHGDQCQARSDMFLNRVLLVEKDRAAFKKNQLMIIVD